VCGTTSAAPSVGGFRVLRHAAHALLDHGNLDRELRNLLPVMALWLSPKRGARNNATEYAMSPGLEAARQARWLGGTSSPAARPRPLDKARGHPRPRLLVCVSASAPSLAAPHGPSASFAGGPLPFGYRLDSPSGSSLNTTRLGPSRCLAPVAWCPLFDGGPQAVWTMSQPDGDFRRMC
jgi:hypothetical protein